MNRSYKAIIVDDEPLVRDDLRYMLRDHPDIEIVGEADGIDAAKAALSEVRPDIVFLDIELRGGSGFDIVPHIDAATHVIFFTAHDEFAVRAFEVNALDFLLKPVVSDRLAASLDRVRARSAGRISATEPLNPLKADDHVFIRTDTKQRFVPLGAIVAVSAAGGNYTALHLEDGMHPLVRRTLKQWENILPESLFFRVHRSSIANLNRIKRIEKVDNGSWHLFLSSKTDPLEVSRRAMSRLSDLIEAKS